MRSSVRRGCAPRITCRLSPAGSRGASRRCVGTATCLAAQMLFDLRRLQARHSSWRLSALAATRDHDSDVVEDIRQVVVSARA